MSSKITGFTKAHALGNDFIIIDGLDRRLSLDEEKIVKLCDRHFGIGADGVLMLMPSKIADYRMRIFNADGSEAEMCGNGIRCLAQYMYSKGLHKKNSLAIETIAGNIKVKLSIGSDQRLKSVEVDMGMPVFERSAIPMKGPKGEVDREEIRVGTMDLEVTCVSMGNPHCVVFTNNAASAPVEKLGPMIENHILFPERTNVEFVEVMTDSEISMRVWERGAGETLACGTGAAASLAAAAKIGLTRREVKMHLAGGDLEVMWKEDGHVYITGSATLVYEGKIDEDWYGRY